MTDRDPPSELPMPCVLDDDDIRPASGTAARGAWRAAPGHCAGTQPPRPRPQGRLGYPLLKTLAPAPRGGELRQRLSPATGRFGLDGGRLLRGKLIGERLMWVKCRVVQFDLNG